MRKTEDLAKKRCPACGSVNVASKTGTTHIEIPYAERAFVETRVDTCLLCNTEGDFEGVNDTRIEEVLRVGTLQSVDNMVSRLEASDKTLPYIERVLDLPLGTIQSWRTQCSPEAIVLLRILCSYPSIVELMEAYR